MRSGRCRVKVVFYGTEAERRELEEIFSGLPDYCYRNIGVVGFSDYDRLIAGLDESPPALIIVAMNGADGMEGVIAAKHVQKDTPIVWFSDDKGFGTQSYRLGCAYFHEKPLSPEIISQAMAKCV